MADYKKDRSRVDAVVRKSGVVVVMNKNHVKNPEHMVTTMWEVYQAGDVAECTFRIDKGILAEAMQELTAKRAECPTDNPFILGVGSVINPAELEAAVEMGFDMIVAPANVMGGYGRGEEFVKICQGANVFSAPAIFTPTELQYFIERDDGLEPDCSRRTCGKGTTGELLCRPAASIMKLGRNIERQSAQTGSPLFWGCRRR